MSNIVCDCDPVGACIGNPDGHFPMNKLSRDLRNKQILACYSLGGMSIREIAKEFDMSRGMIHIILRKQGAVMNRRGWPLGKERK